MVAIMTYKLGDIITYGGPRCYWKRERTTSSGWVKPGISMYHNGYTYKPATRTQALIYKFKFRDAEDIL